MEEEAIGRFAGVDLGLAAFPRACTVGTRKSTVTGMFGLTESRIFTGLTGTVLPECVHRAK
eukprot:432669-Hanusia_phi.AAC.1